MYGPLGLRKYRKETSSKFSHHQFISVLVIEEESKVYK